MLPHVSKPNWRPRIYSTTNPGGVGHAWYRTKFVAPFLEKREVETRFVPARVSDNRWNNPDYVRVLEGLSGWQKRAWLDGDWDIAAGQFFTSFRREVHVVSDFDDTRAREWFCALDYGFAHYTVVLLGCTGWRRQPVRGGRTRGAAVAAAAARGGGASHARAAPRAGARPGRA